MSYESWNSQIKNRNFLAPTGYKFNLSKKPKIDFFCDSANIPGINLGSAIQPTPLKQIPIPGDTISYEDLVITFNVDEDLENYLEIHNWITQFGYPNDFSQYQQLLDEDKSSRGRQNARSGMSDATLIIYNSNFLPNLKVTYKDVYPSSLSEIKFESKTQEVRYVTASAVFKYTIYDIVKL